MLCCCFCYTCVTLCLSNAVLVRESVNMEWDVGCACGKFDFKYQTTNSGENQGAGGVTALKAAMGSAVKIYGLSRVHSILADSSTATRVTKQ